MKLCGRQLTLIWFLSCGLPHHFVAAERTSLYERWQFWTAKHTWTLTKPVGDARRRAAWEKNLKEGIDNLVDDKTACNTPCSRKSVTVFDRALLHNNEESPTSVLVMRSAEP
jgi:hypothetical protein